MKYPVTIVLAVAIGLLAAAPQAATSAQTTPTPPPPPPDVTQSQAPAAPTSSAAPAVPEATPTPSLDTLLGPTPKPKTSAKPGATPSPPPDDRKGLDGVWELQIQTGGDNVVYNHFNIKQTGNALTGTYLDNQQNKKFPLSGSVDGDTVRMVVSLPDGSTILLQGRLDGTTDMIGMFTDPKQNVPFTAAYRPKEKWIDNLNANPGLPSGGGQTGGIPPQ